MKLIEKQFKFAELLPRLIDKVYQSGYTITLGEALRTPEQAHINAIAGTGIEHSLHLLKLAIDLNLFKDGKYLPSMADHMVFGIYWESLSTTKFTCIWGGRFGDGNHYSIEHDGVK